MALHFLLDEHISPDVVRALHRTRPKARVTAIRDWEEGSYLTFPDDAILAVALQHHMTLVTYDRRTITPLLAQMAESSTRHGGVVLVDERTIAPNDLGGLTRALVQLWDALRGADWTNRVVYLVRPRS